MFISNTNLKQQLTLLERIIWHQNISRIRFLLIYLFYLFCYLNFPAAVNLPSLLLAEVISRPPGGAYPALWVSPYSPLSQPDYTVKKIDCFIIIHIKALSAWWMMTLQPSVKAAEILVNYRLALCVECAWGLHLNAPSLLFIKAERNSSRCQREPQAFTRLNTQNWDAAVTEPHPSNLTRPANCGVSDWDGGFH